MTALALHAIAFYALTRQLDDRLGAGGQSLDAISIEVNLVPSSALESLHRADTPAEDAAAATDEMTDMPQADPAKSEKPKESSEERRTNESEQPAQVAQPLVKHPDRNDEQPKPEQKKDSGQTNATSGGAPSRSAAPSPRPVQGLAIASAGEVRAYAKQVAAALGRAKPKGAHMHGIVKVSFAVGEDGRLEFVHVRQSSGNPKLDEIAVAAVRRAAFPSPPPHFTHLQRSFELPYQFR
jgi:protein TonB